jgi:hypothetical protein
MTAGRAREDLLSLPQPKLTRFSSCLVSPRFKTIGKQRRIVHQHCYYGPGRTRTYDHRIMSPVL